MSGLIDTVTGVVWNVLQAVMVGLVVYIWLCVPAKVHVPLDGRKYRPRWWLYPECEQELDEVPSRGGPDAPDSSITKDIG